MVIVMYDGKRIACKSVEFGLDCIIVDGCECIPFREVLRIVKA